MLSVIPGECATFPPFSSSLYINAIRNGVSAGEVLRRLMKRFYARIAITGQRKFCPVLPVFPWMRAETVLLLAAVPAQVVAPAAVVAAAYNWSTSVLKMSCW